MPFDNFVVNWKPLHTIEMPYRKENYFKPLPNYPEFLEMLNKIDDEINIGESWTDSLKDEYNGKKHHPNSDIYGLTKYAAKREERYGSPRKFIAEKNPKNWMAMENFITSKPTSQNPWFNSSSHNRVQSNCGALGRIQHEWDNMSSYHFLLGMIKRKVAGREDKDSKHYVGKTGEKSRIFDLVNGYYAISVDDESSYVELNAFTSKFILKLNNEEDYRKQREYDPDTGLKLLPNQELIVYSYENPKGIYHKKLVYEILVKKEVAPEIEIELDIDLIIKYFMAMEKIQHGSINSPTSSMGKIQDYFRNEPYKSALADRKLNAAKLAKIITSPSTVEKYDEMILLSDDDIQLFIDENKSQVEVEFEFETVEEYELRSIKISDIITSIDDTRARESISLFRPPISAKDTGGARIMELLETIVIGENNYIIKITNEPSEVLLQNTSQEWGMRTEDRWDGNSLKGHISCINYNGVYSAGPFFDFYNGNGVAFVAKVNDVEALNEYKHNIEKGVQNAISPEEFYNSEDLCTIVGRFSLRWGDKTNQEGDNIGWGIGIEPTAYPRSQDWTYSIIQSLGVMFQEIKDNSGNSIWDSGTVAESGRPKNVIKAPYKNGWSYLDYNGDGYQSPISKNDYDCESIGRGSDKALIPNYDEGLKFGGDTSTRAIRIELQEGIDIDYESFVNFEFRNFQEITGTGGLLSKIQMYGGLQPSIYRAVAQNPQIWVSEVSFSKVIRGLMTNTQQIMNHPIRQEFLELALSSSNKNISWLLQPSKESISIAQNLDKYVTTKDWNKGLNCLVKTIFNHSSVLETFVGHTPDISIQQHLYNQNFIIRELDREIGNASDLYLLQLHKHMDDNSIIPMDNAVISDIIRKLKKSVGQNLNSGEVPKYIYPQIDINWDWWSHLSDSANLFANDKKILLTYYQLMAINNLTYNPSLSEVNYIALCEMTEKVYTIIEEYIRQASGIRQYNSLKMNYNKLYQSLSVALLYNKSQISSPCYSDDGLFNYTIHPELPDIKVVLGWAFNSLHKDREPWDGTDILEQESRSFLKMRNNNPFSSMDCDGVAPLQLTNLQNNNTIKSWQKLPCRDEYKLTMFYYLYHFSNSPRSYRSILKGYMKFLESLRIKGYDLNLYSAYTMLFDTTIDDGGQILPSNPYINVTEVKLIRSQFLSDKYIGEDIDLSRLRSNIILRDWGEPGMKRIQFNDGGLSEYIRLILESDVSLYGYGNLFSLLRTPFQFRMAERFILKTTMGEYVIQPDATSKRPRLDKVQYTFIIPEVMCMKVSDLTGGEVEAYIEEQDTLFDVENRLKLLAKYLSYLSSNPYISQTIQARLILSTQQTNAYGMLSKVVKSQPTGEIRRETYLHYSDIFDLYCSNAYNEIKYKVIIQNLVKNPIIAKTTINQLLTNVDDSLMVDFITNSKFDFEGGNILNLTPEKNKILIDYAPTIIKDNLGISDELRLKLFELYLDNLFNTPERNMIDTIIPFKEFALGLDNFRQVQNFSQMKNMLSQLTFNHLTYWRGGFSKFGINRHIPNNITRVGDTINEQIISVNKPQVIIDINFKPPYEGVYTTSIDPFVEGVGLSQFLTLKEGEDMVSLQIQLNRTADLIQELVNELGFESMDDIMAEFDELADMGDESLPLIEAELELSRINRRISHYKDENKQTRNSAPVEFKIRYIEESEETQRGLKLSGSYWDSDRTRVTNKWSEIYPSWMEVYGYGAYGPRGTDGDKNWKNQITLVFYDDNPNTGWDVISETGKVLPKWRAEDENCDKAGLNAVIFSMVENMKNHEENLIPLLKTYADFIEHSGHFKYRSINKNITSDKIHLLNNSSFRLNMFDLCNIYIPIDTLGLWQYLEYEGSNNSAYTENPFLFTLFLEQLERGQYRNLNRPAQILLEIIGRVDTPENYEEALTQLKFITRVLRFKRIPEVLYINLGELGIQQLHHYLNLYEHLKYPAFLRKTSYRLMRGLNGKIKGVPKDIYYFNNIFESTRNVQHTRLHDLCRGVLMTRREDWVEYMRESNIENPEALVQEAEETSKNLQEKINIHEMNIKKYIKKILGSDINA